MRFLGYEPDQTVAALARGTFLLSPTFNSLISSKPSLTVVFTVPGSISNAGLPLGRCVWSAVRNRWSFLPFDLITLAACR